MTSRMPPKAVYIFAVWACVYPLATVLAWLTGLALPQAPLAARTAVLTAVLVPAIVLGVVPAIRRVLGG